MNHEVSTNKIMPCSLSVTDTARKGMMKIARDEHSFFAIQNGFNVYIEKRPENRNGNMSFRIFFDNQSNDVLSKRIEDKVAVMECIYKNEGFLATGFHVRGKRETVRTNRRLFAKLKFHLGRNSSVTMPMDLYTSLRELPIAEDRSEYVKKRIASWEGYLRIQEKNADVDDITTAFSNVRYNDDFSKLTIVCKNLKTNDWKTIRGFSAKMQGSSHDIGNVTNVKKSKQTIEIELSRKYQDLLRRNEWQPKAFKEIVFSNFAELSQVRRLRKGFKDLEDGLAANANLERILFEERPTVRISKPKKDLVFHNELNTFQKEAVTGAMTSNDLYVIQGPPGTGKTTVISEICHQNVKAGLRTLVASQANLAVDNALGRLLSHQDIRILRYGRTESIEEEGKKFIEENVALNWKSQTIDAVKNQLGNHLKKEHQLNINLNESKEQLLVLETELATLDEKIREIDITKNEYQAYSDKIQKCNENLVFTQREQEELVNIHTKLSINTNELCSEITKIEKLLQAENISSEKIMKMETLEKELVLLKKYISHSETIELIKHEEASLEKLKKDVELEQMKMKRMQELVAEIQLITKLNKLERSLNTAEIILPFELTRKITTLNELISVLKSTGVQDTYADWKTLINRLEIAIAKIGIVLKKNGFIKQPVRNKGNSKPSTVKEIHVLIDRVGGFLIDDSVKQFLESRNYSPEKYEYLEKLSIALEVLTQKLNYSQSKIGNVENSKHMYTMIKNEVTAFLEHSIFKMKTDVNEHQIVIEGHELELSTLKQKASAVGYVKEMTTIASAIEELARKEEMHSNYVTAKKALEEHSLHVQKKKLENEQVLVLLADNTLKIQNVNEKLKGIQLEMLELEETRTVLADLLEENPEELREEVSARYYKQLNSIEKMQMEKKRFPAMQSLQQEWLDLLMEANAYDLDEIRKMYVRHANVIGTTCVASARRDFMEEYPTFDVVIIDEVSKATPPELLLPMLKGKKIILVGDHHQLPPLVGQETLEEFLVEIDSPEEKNELNKLLKESLFERLFRTLPKQNKTMLGIQYRMHESIMQTITPFYEEANYSLKCGLADSNVSRDHLLSSRFVNRKNHVLWFDMPNEPNYFEDKVKGGTSRFNQSELIMIKELLLDLNEASGKLKVDGLMKPNAKKSIGVISFYGEQVKRINRLIDQELMPEHLHCRTGSVDKFQGMEMDVIILSFVRNHRDKGGDIGFAKDYRRLNVALSRARELLIIVGSSEMFTLRVKDAHSKKMYGRLLEHIKSENGFRDSKGNIRM
ncbi:AAA domain-containing protein [Sporosarcina siberiensis]|uniref:AAA domain-containing protein n=1 Tax=Sporosarcina siberiensis TaxID=1365606 RepID=A0ABW4SCK0_9BACL